MFNLIVLMLFPLLMAYAASSDLLTMRISNKVIMLLLAGFVLVAFLMGMSWPEIGWHVAAGIAVLIFAFAFFAFGWVGGGDAKLASATALWLGFTPALPYLLYASVLGGMLTLAILAIRHWPLPLMLSKVEWIHRLHHPRTGIPYGIALAAAGLLIYSDTAIYQYFIS